MPKYDVKCEQCEYIWEAAIPASKVKDYAPECPECESNFTKIVWLAFPKVDRAKDPYDYLDGKHQNPGKKIISGPKYSSKTTV